MPDKEMIGQWITTEQVLEDLRTLHMAGKMLHAHGFKFRLHQIMVPILQDLGKLPGWSDARHGLVSLRIDVAEWGRPPSETLAEGPKLS